MEDLLKELRERLLRSAGDNLHALVLYGSAVTGEYRKHHSDLNILCLLKRTGPTELEALHEPFSWWKRKGFQLPYVFTEQELRAAADIFAIELLDMKASHRMIFGDDFFPSLEIPTRLHKQQVERELRTSLVRLRQGMLAIPPRDRVLLSLMDASVSAFVTLFRHALIAFGEEPPPSKRQVIERAAQIVKVSPEAFLAVFDVHLGRGKASEIDAQQTLRGYVALVESVTEEADRRLAQS